MATTEGALQVRGGWLVTRWDTWHFYLKDTRLAWAQNKGVRFM